MAKSLKKKKISNSLDHSWGNVGKNNMWIFFFLRGKFSESNHSTELHRGKEVSSDFLEGSVPEPGRCESHKGAGLGGGGKGRTKVWLLDGRA